MPPLQAQLEQRTNLAIRVGAAYDGQLTHLVGEPQELA